MASFSSEFPYAIHLFPLHAWKSIEASGRLLSKKDRGEIGLTIERRSSGEVDRALGFTDHVHFYLSRTGDSSDASILASKMGRAKPFPHLALRISTRHLEDKDCIVSCWNIARSKPRVGFWPPGTTPSQIREEWDRFRGSRPGAASRGHWVDPLAVPVLMPSHFGTQEALLRTKGEELLLRSPFGFGAAEPQLWSFSSWDTRSLLLLGKPTLRLVSKVVKGYTSMPADPVDTATRDAINDYLTSPSAPLPDLDFD
jgi:hypothetical protein